MKIAELQTRDPVRDTGTASNRSYFRNTDGWEISFEQGLVTVRKNEIVRLVPLGNVAWMTPAPKDEAKGKAA